MARNPEYKALRRWWLTAFAYYALAEAAIQLIFLFLLNTFGENRISIPEFHLVMWLMQCLLIWPIWGVAWLVRRQRLLVQITVNLAFYIIYTKCWFGPVQDLIHFLYTHLVQVTRAHPGNYPAYLDRGNEYAYINYQLLKHMYRLAWFFMAAWFYNYRREEQQRLALAVANRELQLKLMRWRLNPSFYFKTIQRLSHIAQDNPVNTTGPILQLAGVMEYVIYDAKEKLTDVKKELRFLDNYIQLKNAEPGCGATFEIQVTGQYEHLKIAPLLFTGIIDELAAAAAGEKKPHYRLQFSFSGNEMEVQVENGPGGAVVRDVTDADLQQRLGELYEGRHKTGFAAGTGAYYIQLTLHHA